VHSVVVAPARERAERQQPAQPLPAISLPRLEGQKDPCVQSWKALRLLPPKPSSEAQLLESRDGLQRMMVQIPLTGDERAAAESDHATVERLLGRLIDTAREEHSCEKSR
jgi:hypothetical protein